MQLFLRRIRIFRSQDVIPSSKLRNPPRRLASGRVEYELIHQTNPLILTKPYGGGIYASPLPPSTAPARLCVGRGARVPGSKTASKSIKKSIIFFRSMLAPFWVPFESLLGPLLAPKSTQYPSKMPFQALSSSKTRYSRKPYKNQ